jgi:hypothetical protein
MPQVAVAVVILAALAVPASVAMALMGTAVRRVVMVRQTPAAVVAAAASARQQRAETVALAW